MNFTNLQTLAIAALVVYFGMYLKKKISFIDRYNLPSPVIGGFVFAICVSILKSYGLVELTFLKNYEESLMIAFFASIGYSASLRLLKEGGRLVLIFLALALGGLLLQVGAGLGVAKILGEHPLMGILTGPIALTGGPGTALAFAPLIEAKGVEGAPIIGLTAAMGGILIGGLLGNPIATFLIRKHRLKSELTSQSEERSGEFLLRAFPGKDIVVTILALCFIMGIGTTVSSWINDLGVTLPVYIGSMVIAAIVRNIEDLRPTFHINPDWIEEIGGVALTLFIATAIMTLRLEELRHAALPLVMFLTTQALFVAVFALGPSFKFTGKDYEASVISAGYVGFMMGTSANAMANMSSLVQKYGPSPKAFLVVPLVGSCFIDFINAAIITLFINLF